MSLKVCWCGSYPRTKRDDHGRYWFVECGSCGRASIHSRTQEEAEEGWNNPRDFEGCPL